MTKTININSIALTSINHLAQWRSLFKGITTAAEINEVMKSLVTQEAHDINNMYLSAALNDALKQPVSKNIDWVAILASDDVTDKATGSLAKNEVFKAAFLRAATAYTKEVALELCQSKSANTLGEVYTQAFAETLKKHITSVNVISELTENSAYAEILMSIPEVSLVLEAAVKSMSSVALSPIVHTFKDAVFAYGSESTLIALATAIKGANVGDNTKYLSTEVSVAAASALLLADETLKNAFVADQNSDTKIIASVLRFSINNPKALEVLKVLLTITTPSAALVSVLEEKFSDFDTTTKALYVTHFPQGQSDAMDALLSDAAIACCDMLLDKVLAVYGLSKAVCLPSEATATATATPAPVSAPAPADASVVVPASKIAIPQTDATPVSAAPNATHVTEFTEVPSSNAPFYFMGVSAPVVVAPPVVAPPVVAIPLKISDIITQVQGLPKIIKDEVIGSAAGKVTKTRKDAMIAQLGKIERLDLTSKAAGSVSAVVGDLKATELEHNKEIVALKLQHTQELAKTHTTLTAHATDLAKNILSYHADIQRFVHHTIEPSLVSYVLPENAGHVKWALSAVDINLNAKLALVIATKTPVLMQNILYVAEMTALAKMSALSHGTPFDFGSAAKFAGALVVSSVMHEGAAYLASYQTTSQKITSVFSKEFVKVCVPQIALQGAVGAASSLLFFSAPFAAANTLLDATIAGMQCYKDHSSVRAQSHNLLSLSNAGATGALVASTYETNNAFIGIHYFNKAQQFFELWSDLEISKAIITKTYEAYNSIISSAYNTNAIKSFEVYAAHTMIFIYLPCNAAGGAYNVAYTKISGVKDEVVAHPYHAGIGGGVAIVAIVGTVAALKYMTTGFAAVYVVPTALLVTTASAVTFAMNADAITNGLTTIRGGAWDLSAYIKTGISNGASTVATSVSETHAYKAIVSNPIAPTVIAETLVYSAYKLHTQIFPAKFGTSLALDAAVLLGGTHLATTKIVSAPVSAVLNYKHLYYAHHVINPYYAAKGAKIYNEQVTNYPILSALPVIETAAAYTAGIYIAKVAAVTAWTHQVIAATIIISAAGAWYFAPQLKSYVKSYVKPYAVSAGIINSDETNDAIRKAYNANVTRTFIEEFAPLYKQIHSEGNLINASVAQDASDARTEIKYTAQAQNTLVERAVLFCRDLGEALKNSYKTKTSEEIAYSAFKTGGAGLGLKNNGFDAVVKLCDTYNSDHTATCNKIEGPKGCLYAESIMLLESATTCLGERNATDAVLLECNVVIYN